MKSTAKEIQFQIEVVNKRIKDTQHSIDKLKDLVSKTKKKKVTKK